MTPIVSSTFDIAHWFLQRGELSRIFVSPLKLQRLLYLAQSHYAGQHGGAPLMPSVFVVSEVGPLEPNIYRAIEHEPPKVSVRDLPEGIMEFAEYIWQEFGAQPIEELNRLVTRDPAYKEAELTRGVGAMIGLDAMYRLYVPLRGKPAAQKPATKELKRKIPETLPDGIPNFIAEILAAARDEAGEEARAPRPASRAERPARQAGGGSGTGLAGKSQAPWITGAAAGNG
jgi:uncharacterized phage-associated protein